jgi:hypothetical protein
MSKPDEKALTLYEISSELAAFMDTEALVPEEQLAAFQAEFLEKTRQAIAKRGNVIRAIRHLEGQIDLARAEENRLAAWRASLSSGLERFKDYVIKCIELSGQKKVEADNGSLSIQANPESVEVTDLEALPDEFKSVTVKMPAAFFREVVEGYVDGQAISATFTPDKAAIRTALKEGREVPGADSRFGRLRLVVR